MAIKVSFDPTRAVLSTLTSGEYIYKGREHLSFIVDESGARYWVAKATVDGEVLSFFIGNADAKLATVEARAARAISAVRGSRMEDDVERFDPFDAAAEARSRSNKVRYSTLAEFYPDALERVARVRNWLSRTTYLDWDATLRLHVLPTLGNVALCELTAEQIAETLEPIWRRPVGSRCQRYLAVILDLAVRMGAIHENPARWHGNLDQLLPSRRTLSRGVQAKHHAAVSPEDLRLIARYLRDKNGSLVAMCALFGLLTACRRSEFILASAEEVRGNVFYIPPERRKDKVPEAFRMPLSTQSMDILSRVSFIGDKSPHYYWSLVKAKPMAGSNVANALREAALAVLGHKEISIHGTRSSFADWCMNNGVPMEVCEKCLMHSIGSAVVRAYHRDDWLERRREVMQRWADFLLKD